MLSIFDISFWLYFFAFSIVVFFAFFIPGDVFLKRLSLSVFQRIVLGIIVGMVLWAWQGFILGYLHARWLSYIYLAAALLLWLKFNFNFEKKIFNKIDRAKLKKIDLLLIVIIFLGTFIQLSAVWFTGALYKDGLYFCCGNIADSILQIALTNQVVKQIPPFEPGMFGVIVQNYHYWGNLVTGELIRVFNLPLISTQYQYFTLLLSLLLGLSAIAFSQIASLGKNYIRWLVFFLYLGGDLIFAFVSFMRKELNFEMSSLEDGAKFLVNPPRAISIIVFFAALSLLVLWIKKRNIHAGLLTVLLLGSLIGFKVYTGIFALSGALALFCYFVIKRDFRAVTLFSLVFIISAIIYLPVNRDAGGLYFTGLYLFENFIVQPWMMLHRLELARRIYLEHKSYLRIMQYELIYIFLFIITIFGTKLLGFLQTRRSLSLLPKELNIFLITGIIVSIVVGFFFQQKAGGANTFNFLVSVFIIGSVYSALACAYFLEKIKNKVKFILIAILIVLTVPRVLHQTISNVKNIIKPNYLMVDSNELDSIKYIQENTAPGAIIMVNYEKFKLDAKSPYLSFLANRPMYLSGLVHELSDHGIDFSDRKAIVDELLSSTDNARVATLLQQTRIDYLYLSPSDFLIATVSAEFTQTVFQNAKVRLIKVSKDKISTHLKHSKDYDK